MKGDYSNSVLRIIIKVKMKEENLTVKKENFIEKVKRLVKKFFGKEKKENLKADEKQNDIINTETINEESQKEQFINQIKVTDFYDGNLLRTQNEYEKGTITASDIPENEIKRLIKLYEKQIKNLNNKIVITNNKILKNKK